MTKKMKTWHKNQKDNTHKRYQIWRVEYERLFKKGLRHEVILQQISDCHYVSAATVWRAVRDLLRKK